MFEINGILEKIKGRLVAPIYSKQQDACQIVATRKMRAAVNAIEWPPKSVDRLCRVTNI